MMHRLCRSSLVALLALASAAAGQTSQGGGYQQAQTAVMEGKWEEGISILHTVLEAQPRDLKALNLMGLALTGKGDPTGANRYFNQALQIDPAFYPARKNLAVNELHLKQLPQAEQDFKTVLASVPKDPVANMYAGELAFARKDCAAAAQHLELAGPWLEKDARLSVMTAECESSQGRAESAIARTA